MDVSQLEPDKPVSLLELEIIGKQEVREWNGNRICSCVVRDSSGECVLSLWNDEVDQFKRGDFVTLKKGWCKEYRGVLQVSSGKFGEIELILGSGKPKEKESAETLEPQRPPNWHLRPTLNEIRSK